MPSPPHLRQSAYYHIFNRGNNRENIFREETNYRYFLKLYAQHIEPVAETYAYCLLKNHFHILVRIRDAGDLPKVPGRDALSSEQAPSRAFSNLFNAYAKAVNKAWGRTGSLFEHPFGRVEVTNHGYLCHLVTYIHRNPQRHGLVDDFTAWPHSSYHALAARGGTRLERETVLSWFDTWEGWLMSHARESVEPSLAVLWPDDFD